MATTLREAEERMLGRMDVPPPQLSPKELEVGRLLIQAKHPEQIGKELGIKASTVKQHLVRMYLKMGIHDGCKMVKLAVRLASGEIPELTGF